MGVLRDVSSKRVNINCTTPHDSEHCATHRGDHGGPAVLLDGRLGAEGGGAGAGEEDHQGEELRRVVQQLERLTIRIILHQCINLMI